MQRQERSPEHPCQKPYWLMYAQYDGKKVVLLDIEVQKEHTALTHQNKGRYAVVVGPFSCAQPLECFHPNVPHGRKIWSGNDLEIARFKFEKSAEILRESGFDILF